MTFQEKLKISDALYEGLEKVMLSMNKNKPSLIRTLQLSEQIRNYICPD